MAVSSVLGIWFGRHRLFAGFVFDEQFFCPVDIALLTPRCAAPKKHDPGFTVFGKVDAVAWPPVDHVFAKAIEPFDVRRVPQRHSNIGDSYLGGCLRRSTVKTNLAGV